MTKRSRIIFLILLLALGLRFVGLSWGLPYQFHPDEWNMASAITRLSWENKLNPGFFAYGQLPLYLAFFSARLYNLIPTINLKSIDLPEAIFFLRFWSALAGAGIVGLTFLISRKLVRNEIFSLLAALLVTLTPGLIQTSHFGTTESLLTLAFLGVLYFSLEILGKPSFKNYLLAAAFLGVGLGVKITALAFAVPLLFSWSYWLVKAKTWRGRAGQTGKTFLALGLGAILAILSSPYLVLDFNESKRILTYEAQIATGEIPVFYTRQFINTQPVFFQLEKVFPYALGWPSFLLGLAGAGAALAFLLKAVLGKKKEVFYCRLFLVFSAFFLYFLSQAFLFCKWTRFMAPIFPFFPLFGAFFLEKISRSRKFRLSEGFKKGFFSLLTLILITPGVIFSSIYFRPDIRFAASSWIYENLPAGAKILLEAGNVIDLPIVPPNFKSTRTNYQSLSFDFYHLDENPSLLPKLLSALENSGYIIVPSRRIFGNHLRLQQDYPLTAKYHQLLFSGELGFRLIKEMAVFPSFLSDEGAEETWSVFDHPKIRIYQKDRPMTAKDYETLFEKN